LAGQILERDETAHHQKLSAALPENRANPLIGAGPGIKTKVERAVGVSPRNIRVPNSAAPGGDATHHNAPVGWSATEHRSPPRR